MFRLCVYTMTVGEFAKSVRDLYVSESFCKARVTCFIYMTIWLSIVVSEKIFWL